jgi:thiol-disulfide isomerase/thioredoxin
MAFLIALCVAQALGMAKDSFKPFALKTPEGAARSLRDYLARATLVTFYFPTCGYCNAEFPHLQRLYDKYRDRGFTMVSINIMPEQDSQVPEWRAKHQYTFPVLIGAKLEALENTYDIRATPTNFLLDSKGKVLLKQTGYKPGDENTLEQKIREALDPQHGDIR